MSSTPLKLLLAVLTAFGFLTGCEGKHSNTMFPSVEISQLSSTKELAAYEGGKVTGAEFNRFLAVEGFLNPDAPLNDTSYRKELLRQLVMQKILISHLKTSDKVQKQVEDMWKQIKRSYDEDTRKQGYEVLNIRSSDVTNQLTNQFKLEEYFRKQITSDELTAYYKRIENDLTRVSFTQLAFSTLHDAAAAAAELQKGTSLQDVQKKYADVQTVSKIENADNLKLSSLSPSFIDVLKKQHIGESSEPIKMGKVYYILILKQKDKKTESEVKEEMMKELVLNHINRYIQDQLPRFHVTFNLR
ncbi:MULTISPECIES: peptidyl-prolyl cis-trans isomerase [Priestia]|uniref:peptidylprolyl isomerase n=2 Tax=Priestia megaterium TaxID=1404 RepID=A0ABD4WPF2_PRIMG|nr:peptidyl-prolyl cis-trans isomerase [Priestia megaterium]MCF6797793.1 peptidyl-prolyl cis-trans isomerase [Bacillus sp. ET1]MBD8843469.1 peptidyl-prolyl cis-trans isomerase [Priestia megaterium]MDD9782014.1 peptidyl-prolyl cis-trans isomerase [Priestia megaterium]MDN4863968.1 peptidyl-prolyl cis-trans isomerase [Priestia megaterium]MED3811899.1 peptidyl-prolyl cis-trans isomerase [Priestia megaterium]